uniref:Uncharacterized protein n=2 Tax=Opuntia streptacantha TaxID=393608 RepID=A0A7C8Z0X5_OPUST
MATDEKQTQKRMTRKLSIRQINVEDIQAKAQEQAQSNSTMSTSPLQSPLRSPSLKKSLSGKMNCLCAPTTHAGSFRCRLHRNGSSFRRLSIGADLNELDDKSSLTAAPLETT